jgi:hypothetical protein
MSTSEKVFEVLKRLRPYDIDLKKIRVGSAFDGGYILADILTPDQVVLSYGLGAEIAFDLEMAGRGHQIHMFDHTIGNLPAMHPHFRFHREGVAGSSEPGTSCYTVEDHLERFAIQGDRLILKMDVEGWEWEVMSRIPEHVLARFEQIGIEVHDFGRMREPEFLDKVLASLENINRHFTLFHVHANNHNPMECVGGFALYNLLELSYIKTALVKRSPSRTFYPTALDNPNVPDKDDYILSSFPFWPEGLAGEEYEAQVRSFHAKNGLFVKTERLFRQSLEWMGTGEIERAEAGLIECLKLRRDHEGARINLVVLLNAKATELNRLGRHGDAVSSLRAALTLAPQHPILMANLKAVQDAETESLLRGLGSDP